MKTEFLTIKEALETLGQIEKKKKQGIITESTVVIGCARLGSENYKIKAGNINKLKKENFGSAPYCLIIPGKLHFVEEEMIDLWK